ncbi:T9SS type A sorting domain-containing protein [Flavobacterium luteum]|uniref:T9SS type A sorting domain-containing protein n=1 Tax=Flavobacterium luteum TaxID=2026654 RepID=A0A7J5AFB9_9FLAO|nr:T9SS type A sorting domain-containing protein [Flavobacterium luteum]KAB1156262.1 T9SS type A sorting domain-containing protein [Flavobacterium luteum]
MNLKLLLLLVFFSTLSSAQVPINSYFTTSTDPSVYDIVTSSVPLDQTTSGANLVWDFNQLTKVGESIDYISSPTASEITTYPKSTTIVANATSQIYYSKAANALSITALKNNDLELNYISNNATIGNFPLNYGYSNTDTTAGTFIYGMYLGTFTGTITTSFDSYGILNNGTSEKDASRLKTVQNISLNYGILTNVGTAIQTTYNYYDATNGSNSLVFRNTTLTVSVPLLGINQTINQIERFNTMLLGTNDNTLQSSSLQIIPNPIEDVLNFTTNLKINSINISDIHGRVILESNVIKNVINLAHLQRGVYFVTFNTDKGSQVRKIIKK